MTPGEISPENQRRIELTVSSRDADSIPKVAQAGAIIERDGVRAQVMHNGVLVVEDGYYGAWMTEVIRRLRGHHEPQEEAAFHVVVERLRRDEARPAVLELGSFWAYYALWVKRALPAAEIVLVEPDPANLEIGRRNVALNGASARFVEAAVGREHGATVDFPCESDGMERPRRIVTIDGLLADQDIDRLDLVIADVQGAELDLLIGAERALAKRRIRFLVLSTHHHSISGDPLVHQRCLEMLERQGTHVIAEHTVGESVSGDGLIVGSLDPRDHDLEVSLSRARPKNSLFGEPEYELARAWAERDEARAEAAALRAFSSSRRPRTVDSVTDTDLGERSLSICIPTHHGRAGTLAEALESVARQARAAPGWTLEVCVSDNASRDGTEHVVRAFRRDSGLPVSYHRNERDLGLGPNIFGVLGLARGRWCWPVGSDDHLTDDALAVMTGLLEAHPEATGVAHPRTNFTLDMSGRTVQDLPEFFPLVDETTVYRGADAVLANLGLSWAYLGSHVLRRDRLVEVLASEREAALAHPDWPQVFLLGRLARRHPVWVWYPVPLVKARSHNSYFAGEGGGRKDLAQCHADIVEGLCDVWNGLTAPGDPVRDELTIRTYRIVAAPEAIRAIKARPEHGLRADWTLARAFTPRFARLRAFWLRSAPALVVPGALQRAITSARARSAGPSRP